MAPRVAGRAIGLALLLAACSPATTPTPVVPSSGLPSAAASAGSGTAAPSGGAAASAHAGPTLPRIGGSWAPGPATPTARAENAAVALDGRIYVAGGLDGDGNSLDTFEVYDPETETWTALPPLPEKRDHVGLAVHDGRIILTGGSIFFTGAIRANTWAYDPAAARWSALAAMPAPRSQHGAAALGDRIYVVGGVVRGPDSRALWAYEPASGEWITDLAPMPTEREHLSVVAAGSRIVALGGRKGGNLAVVEAYDPATDTWETWPAMPTARGGMAADVIDGVIHVTGGENLEALSTYAQHEAYDLATRTWSVGPDLPTKRHGVATAVAEGRWYVIGGGRSAMLAVSDVVEVYTP